MNQISAEARSEKGKGASRRLRRRNKTPAVVYGAGKDPVSISLKQDDILHAIEHESFFTQLITLAIDDGESERVVLKDLQRHPYKSCVMHVDFQRVNDAQPVKLTIPLHFQGESEAPGVVLGGTISHHLNNVEVECLPKDIPDFLEMNLSEMQIGDLLHLSSIKMPDGVVITALKYGAKFDAPIAAMYKGKKETK